MSSEKLEMSESQSVEEKIYTIRGKQVMLDKDLAQLYGVETKRLNEQVRRNMERFPEVALCVLRQMNLALPLI